MRQSGNALFLILIAVALFAALSYAVTRSGSDGSNADREQTALAVARMVQYGQGLTTAFQRMRIIYGVSETNVDFYTTQRLRDNGTSYPWDNFNCTAGTCEIFNSDGAGMSYQSFEDISFRPSGWSGSSVMPGHHVVGVYGVVGVGTNLPEIIWAVNAISPEACDEINKQFNIPEDPAYSLIGETAYGYRSDPTTALAASDGWTFGDDETDLIGQHDFCAGNDSDGYNYYHVLVAR